MMETADVLKVFLKYRDDAVVLSGRGGRYWVPITDNEKLDATMGDPAMGGHASYALGIALAQPARRVVLFDSDGDIHMSMGMLATIAEQAPKTFTILCSIMRFMLQPADSQCQMQKWLIILG